MADMPDVIPAPIFNFELRWSLKGDATLNLHSNKKLLSQILDTTSAEIISTYKTDLFSSYILTKSSLFISRDEILLVTCHESDPTPLGDKLNIAATKHMDSYTETETAIIELQIQSTGDPLMAVANNRSVRLNNAPDFNAITNLLSPNYYTHSHQFSPSGFSINAISKRDFKAIHYYHEPKNTLTVTGQLYMSC